MLPGTCDATFLQVRFTHRLDWKKVPHTLSLKPLLPGCAVTPPSRNSARWAKISWMAVLRDEPQSLKHTSLGSVWFTEASLLVVIA